MTKIFLLPCTAIFLSVTSFAIAEPLESMNREENAISLEGPFAFQLDAQRSEGRADSVMACGMKFRNSTLAIRTRPSATSPQLAAAPYYTILHLTGELSDDKAWARIDAFSIDFTIDGRRLDEELRSYEQLSGWVNLNYLCSFLDM